MDNYIVSARKYRPTTFDSVVGQSTLTTTLKNAIATGKLAHAFLFCGPRGVGKTTCARIFAKTINCEHPTADGEACNECESCRAFAEQRSLNIYELDAASNNSVDDMRMLIEQVQVPPQVGRYKVFIIDEVHMLTTQAFNAFLKTLEEPPAHAIFILATTEKHKILPTILSRCQIYDFNRMEVPDIVNHLKGVAEKEGIAYEEEALSVIARKADGGMRDALSIFDQVASFSAGNITYKKVIEDLNILDYDYYFNLTDSLLKGDIPTAMLTFNEILRKGFEGNHFIGGLAAHFRDLLVSRDESTLPLLDVADNVRQRYSEQAKRCKPQFLYRALKLCNDCDVNYRVSRNKRLGVELCLIEVAQCAQEDAPGCGLGPTKTLKPIFAHTATKKQAAPKPAAPKPAAQSQPPAVVNGQAAPAAGALQNAPTHTAQQNPAQQAKRPVPTLSIRKTMEAMHQPQQTTVQENAPAYAAQQKPQRDKAFEAADVNRCWLQYALSLPREYAAMSARMRNMTLEVAPGSKRVTVPVENEQVMKYMQQMQPQVEQYLRNELQNDFVALDLKLVAREAQTRAYSPKEQFAAMLKDSPALETLRQTFKLELA